MTTPDQASVSPLPFVHDLTPAQLRDLQRDAAAAAGCSRFFSDTLADGSEGPELAVIPAGSFVIGAPSDERRFGDLTQHRTAIEAPFAIGRHAVTAEEFERFSAATGRIWQEHLMRSEGRQPAVNVSSEEVQRYADWLSAQTGRRYRLPSETEWEYACRAGSLSAYCFGERLTCGEANIHSLQPSGTPARGWRRFIPFCVPLNKACEVGTYPANVWGLYEMHGNVWEFTASPWTGPLDAENSAGLSRAREWLVTKGGSWFEGALDARAAARKPRHFSELDLNLGFRLVRAL
jgi:formylglycine-generating enzyme required for sulfatase activity